MTDAIEFRYKWRKGNEWSAWLAARDCPETDAVRVLLADVTFARTVTTRDADGCRMQFRRAPSEPVATRITGLGVSG